MMRRLLFILASLVAGAGALIWLKTSPRPADAACAPVTLTEPANLEDTPSPGPLVAEGQFTGATVCTTYGQVTVAIVVRDHVIVDVLNVDLSAREPRSVQLSTAAGATLRERALTAQSADFDIVSGATWTSLAYRQSLQSALDAATHR
jgi:uncharacterized protein with FMN-binding domain